MSENLSSSQVDGAVEKVANLGGMILEAIGFTGASSEIGFLAALKNLAANKDESNLLYFGNALVEDIRCLYRLCEDLNQATQQLDEHINSPEFSAVVANATLHITRTNVESRLKRLAHLIANGVAKNDLEPESLDDMMRAAVELTDADIILLRKLYESQDALLLRTWQFPLQWDAEFRKVWATFVHSGSLDRQEHLNYRSSYCRLESVGLIQQIPDAGTIGVGQEAYALLMDGKKFYERLQEIAVK